MKFMLSDIKQGLIIKQPERAFSLHVAEVWKTKRFEPIEMVLLDELKTLCTATNYAEYYQNNKEECEKFLERLETSGDTQEDLKKRAALMAHGEKLADEAGQVIRFSFLVNAIDFVIENDMTTTPEQFIAVVKFLQNQTKAEAISFTFSNLANLIEEKTATRI